MSIRTTVVLLATALAVAFPVSAEQNAQVSTVSEQVPLDVVLCLLNLASAEQLTLGGMPEELAERISLPGYVEIVGTISHRSKDYSHDRIMGSADMPPQELRRALAASLEASGWEPQSSRSLEVQSGFTHVMGERDHLGFCGPDDTGLSVFVTGETDDGPSAINLTYSGSSEASLCQRQQAQSAQYGMGLPWGEELIPVLEPPEGANSIPGGGGGGPRHMEMGAHVQTDLSSDALLDHYGGQLAAAGWTVGRTIALTRLAAAEISSQTPEGERVTGFLVAKCGLQGREMCEMTLSFSREEEEEDR